MEVTIEFRLLGPVAAVRAGRALPIGGPQQRRPDTDGSGGERLSLDEAIALALEDRRADGPTEGSAADGAPGAA